MYHDEKNKVVIITQDDLPRFREQRASIDDARYYFNSLLNVCKVVLFLNEKTGEVILWKNKFGPTEFINSKRLSIFQKFIKVLFNI